MPRSCGKHCIALHLLVGILEKSFCQIQNSSGAAHPVVRRYYQRARIHERVYPWQVSLDYTNGSVIGLVALYDEPVSIDDVQTALNQRYGPWATANFQTGPVRLWRVEPVHFAIGLSQDDNGMIRLIYLTFDAKHPTSERAMKEILDHAAKHGN